MKIFFDHQIFEVQRFGGISRYFSEIMEKVSSRESAEVSLSLKYSSNEYVKHSSFNKGVVELPRFSNKLLDKILRRLFFFANKRLSIQVLRRQNFDIFHPTYYDGYFLSHLGDKPFVLTVYDMIHEIFPEYFPGKVSKRKQALVKRAAKIIAISECTKKDLIRIFGVSAEKVVVIHLANSLDRVSAAVSPALELPERYILFVGDRPNYKNFDFFVHAMAPLLREDPSLHVLCTGSPFTAKELHSFEELNITKRIQHRSVDDSGLQQLYRNAQAFVFPSLYEGFGLPVLEAFSCSCPAILSAGGSLPEVGGNGAIYFDPKDAQSLRTAVAEVLGSEKLRADLIERGLRRLKSFSWEKTARETEAVYEQVCSELQEVKS